MADKLRTQQQLEQLQSRYVGTGHADTTKHEWASNLHRDSYASYVGHPPLLAYMAVGMGESREKLRAAMIERQRRETLCAVYSDSVDITLMKDVEDDTAYWQAARGSRLARYWLEAAVGGYKGVLGGHGRQQSLM